MDKLKDWLGIISGVISASVVSPIADGAELVMKNIDERLIRIEKRILRKVTSLLIIWFGSILLAFALLFFLIEYLHWSSAAAFFAIGIAVFVVGLLLKLQEPDR